MPQRLLTKMAQTQEEIREKLFLLIRSWFDGQGDAWHTNPRWKLPLMVPSYGSEEVCAAMEVMLSGAVTMGEKVKQFETLFAEYIGVKHAVMVHSGSSANLLALSVLTNHQLPNHLCPGDEVITPAVTWATTVYPILNCGLVPVFVDVDQDTYNISVSEVKRALSPRTKAVMVVHLLGNPCDMEPLQAIADEQGLFLVEDTSEAHGALVGEKKVGRFGALGTFSFFFSHHMSTMEGGMVVTDRDDLAELARMLRTFGWIRDASNRESLAVQYPHIDPRYFFATTGYNFRPTEVQGAFGIHQLEKLEENIVVRQQNARYWNEQLSPYQSFLHLPEERSGTRHVWFGYPLTLKSGAPVTRASLTRHLETYSIETRPIMAGNMVEQPAMQHFSHRVVGDLPQARHIMRNAFYLGNHQGVREEERQLLVRALADLQ